MFKKKTRARNFEWNDEINIPFKSRIKIPVSALFAYSRISFSSYNTGAC